jgi:hypothetical protein
MSAIKPCPNCGEQPARLLNNWHCHNCNLTAPARTWRNLPRREDFQPRRIVVHKDPNDRHAWVAYIEPSNMEVADTSPEALGCFILNHAKELNLEIVRKP